MGNPNLPKEILLEIFARLPAKSVGKCRTLSKHYQTLLSTTKFINKHLITRQQQENVVLTDQWEKFCITTSPTKPDELSQTKGFPDECFNVLGSCNGLVLLNTAQGLVLINPITLKHVTVQEKVKQEDMDISYVSDMCGFGYDSCSDDYKIVGVSSYESNNGGDDGLDVIFVNVYSVRNGVWKRVDGCYPFDGFVRSRYSLEGGAFVNGGLHWLVSKEGFCSCVAVFDLSREVFSEIPLPGEFVSQPVEDSSSDDDGFGMPRSSGVSVIGGCLAIVDNYGNGVTDVWVMKEYGVAESWVKFRIEAEGGKWHSIVATLCYVEDGELLCLTSWDYLFACDLKGGRVRKVVFGGNDTWFSHGMAFVDSLVSPEAW